MPTYNKDAYDISRAFGRIENELLGSMMRNMERHRAEERDYGFDWPQWQALQLQELRRYREENKEKFREDFDNINSQVESALRVAYESGQSDQEAVILDQIRRGKLEANRSFDADFFRLNNRRIDSLVEATTNDIKTTEQAILRMANDKYRQIVFDAQVYFASGGGTYEKVVDMAAHDMLMAGLNCIEYKNGARHTAADYAEMVIRTSGQRAYLRGEGQKRNEWGVHTVIVNKRGNPCPKCAPWCGKVMIDDVYAGAIASEAKESGYPRVSTAMQAGFLHPRCKDTYTTWFPGVSQKPKPWTKEELASLDENARKEAEQKHAEKMAEKCGRVSRFSLDPEKQKIYEKRAEQWGEKAENLKSEELTQHRIGVGQNKYTDRVMEVLDREYRLDKPAKTITEETRRVKKYNSIQEAEEAARAMGVKYAEYGKLPLETANILNDAIETLPPEARPLFVGDHVTLEKFRDAKIGRNSSQFYGVTVDSTGTIFPGRDPVTGRRIADFDAQGSMVGISSRYKTPAKIEAAKKKTQDAYMAKHNGRKWFFNESGEATIYHEMGHVYQDRYGLPAGFKADAERWVKESGCDMLKNPSEAFSEAWAAYHTGNPDLPDYIAKYIAKGTNASMNRTVGSVAKIRESSIMMSEGMFRRKGNSGAFAIFKERMSKKHIREIAKEYGIELHGITLHIDFNEELIGIRFSGRADHENVGGITFFPEAFRNKEELLRTLFHEMQHVSQYKEYGVEYVMNNRGYFEDLAEVAENEFIDRLRKEDKL